MFLLGTEWHKKNRNYYTFSRHGGPREIVLARNCDDSVNFTVLIGTGPSLIKLSQRF